MFRSDTVMPEGSAGVRVMERIHRDCVYNYKQLL